MRRSRESNKTPSVVVEALQSLCSAVEVLLAGYFTAAVQLLRSVCHLSLTVSAALQFCNVNRHNYIIIMVKTALPFNRRVGNVLRLIV